MFSISDILSADKSPVDLKIIRNACNDMDIQNKGSFILIVLFISVSSIVFKNV